MALLAQCPSCRKDVVLPDEAGVADGGAPWAQCPECNELFAIENASRHVVKQATLVDRPRLAADGEATHGELDESELATAEVPKFSSATLAAYLAETEPTATNQQNTEAANETDFESLDDLMRRGREQSDDDESTTDRVESTLDVVADATDTGMNDEPDDVVAESPEADEEPSPAVDRFRGQFSDLYRSEEESVDRVDETAIDDSASYDRIDVEAEDPTAESEADGVREPLRSLDDFLSPTSAESTLKDHGDLNDTVPATTGDDSPTFDFTVQEPHSFDSAKSLRAAMGFGDQDALEVTPPDENLSFDTPDESDVAPELAVAGEAPHGMVAARKRSGLLSAAKTMFGVAGGGVVGLVGGYLLLLWIFHFIGRTDEPLALAQYYPDVVKPSTFQDAPASLTTPIGSAPPLAEVEPGVADSLEPIDDNSVEPANFETLLADEPQPAEQDMPTTPPVFISGAPSFTAAQLQELTGLANEVVGKLVAAGPIEKSKGTSYAQIAALAEALTFGEGANDVSWKANARDVFRPLFDDAAARKQISTIAEFWLVSSKRGHGGIFFCGTLDAGRQQGTVAEYTCTLATDAGQQLTVLAPQAVPVDLSDGAAVAVAGAIIDDPALHIEGYTGDALQAVWVGDLFLLDE